MFSLRFLLLFLPLTIFAQSPSNTLNIIPQPQSVEAKKGSFTLKKDTRLYIPEGQAGWDVPAQYFASLAATSTGYRLIIQPMKKFKDPKGNAIHLVLDPTITSDEGYRMEVKSNSVVIWAKTPAGAFYGMQTLRQLLPPEFGGTRSYGSVKWEASCCIITDAPRFGYRGMHLDVGRHFFQPSFIKKYIDLLAMYKYNTFHWHLTEDQYRDQKIPGTSTYRVLSE
jgi:hexosaminidase